MPLWASNTGHCSSPENRHWKRTYPFLLPPSPSWRSREDPKHISGTLARAPEWDVKPGLTINFLLSIHRKVELSDQLDKETQRFKRNFLHWGGKSSLCTRISIHHYLRISLISSAWTLAFASPSHSKTVRKKQLVLDTGFMFCRDFHGHQERMQRGIISFYPSENRPWKPSADPSARVWIQTQIPLMFVT